MSRTIDERVVSMEFDNSKFESNVKTSLSTLDKLKEALKFGGASKGIEDFGSSIEQTGNKFSALEVIATGALLKIGSQAVTAGERLVKSLSFDQIAAGWQKFADKTTSVATLVAQGNAIEEVNSQLDRLNWFTDETSYNFTEMVSNIAKFTATGKGLEESVNAMEGIATWAALSGQNAQTASRAMYQLSQAMGSGYMRLEDYKSIQNASMDTDEFRQKCLDAAVALGTLKKTGNDTYQSLVAKADAFTKSQFAKSLTEGEWFTSDVMMKVFEEYASAVDQIYAETERTGELASEVIDKIHTKAKQIQAENIGIDETEAINQAIKELGYNFDAFGLKAFEAAQKARTFRDVLDSVKDAVSTGWMNTFELIFGNAEEATEMWTDLANGLWDIFAGPGEARNEWLEDALTAPWEKLTDQIESTGIEMSDFEEALKNAIKADNDLYLDDLIEQFGSLEEAFTKGGISGTKASKLINEALGSLAGSADDAAMSLEDVQKIVDDIWNGKWKNGAERKKLLADAGYNAEALQELVNKGRGYKVTLEDLSDSQLKAIGYTEDQIEAIKELKKQAEETGTPLNELISSLSKPSGRELLIETFYNVLGAIKNIIVPIQEAFQNIFLDSEGLYNAIKWWHDLSENLVMSEETVNKLRRTFEGLFAAIDIVLITIKDAAKGVFEFVGSVLDVFGFKELSAGLLDFTANMGDSIVAFRDQVKEVGLLKAAFGGFGEYLSGVGSGIKEAFTGLIGNFKTLDDFSFSNILTALSEFKTKVKEAFKAGEYGKKVVNVFNKIVDVLKKVWDWIKKVAIQIYEIPAVNERLNGIVTWIQNVWNAISKYLSPAVEAVKDLITEFKNLDKISLSGIWNILKNFGRKIKEAFSISKESKDIAGNIVSGLIIGFKEGIGKVITTVTEFISNIITTVKDLLGIESPSKVFIAIGGFIIAGLIIGLLGGITELEGTLGTVVDTIVKVFTSVDWNKVFVIGTILAFVYSITKMTTAITNLSKALTKTVHPFSSIVESITGFVNGMKSALANEINAKALRSVIISILLLAAAVVVLSYIPWKQALLGLGYLTAIIVLFGVVVFLLNKLTMTAKMVDFAKLAIAISSIGAVMLMIAAAVLIISRIGDTELTNAFAFITGVTILMAGILVVFTLLENKGANLHKAGLALIEIAGAVVILAYVVKMLAEIPEADVDKAIKFISTTLGMIFLLLLPFALIGDNGKTFAKAGTMLIKLSIALALLIGVIKMIAAVPQADIDKGMDFVESLLKLFALLILPFIFIRNAANTIKNAGSMILKMAIAIGLLVLVVKLLASSSQEDINKAYDFIFGVELLFTFIIAVSKLAGQHADKAGSMLLKMAVAIGILALVVKILGNCDSYELGKALTFIMGVEILFGVLIAVSYFAGEHADKAGNMLMKMTVPLLVLVACVALLSFLSPEDIFKGTVCMMALMGMFSFMIKATSKFGDKNNVTGALLALSAALAIMVGSVYLLTTLDTKKALIAVGEITVLLGALVVVMKTLTNMKFEKGQMLKSVGSLFAITLVVAMLAGILYALDKLNVQASIKTVGSLCALLLVMSAACYILSNTNFELKQLGSVTLAMIMLSGILVLLSGVLWILQTLEIEASIPNVIALSILLVAMAGVTAILSKFGSGSLAPALEGAIAMAAVILILGGAIALLAYLVSFGLPEIGENLSSFAEKSSKFFELMKNVDTEATEGALNVSKILMTLAGAEIATAIANFISLFAGSTMDNMSSKLNSFGEAVVAFSEIISGKVDTTAIEAAKNAAEIIATLYDKLPKEGGLAQAIFGESMSLSDFATQMADFGKAIVAFSNEVKGNVDAEAVQAAVSAGEIVATLYEKLPKEGGLCEAIFGGTMGLDTFATQMTKFGEGIVAFSAKVKGNVNANAVSAAVNAGSLVATLYEKLPKDSEGLCHAIFGGTMGLDTFSSQMTDFGAAITGFSDKVKGNVDAEAVSAAVSAGEVIAGLYDALPKEEGVFEKIVSFFSGGGKMSMSDFGTLLSDYGGAVKSFYDSLSDVDPAALTSAVNNTRSLTYIINGMKDLDTSGVDNFTEAIGKLAETSLSGFAETFSALNETIVSGVASLLTTLSGSIINGREMVSNAFATLMTSSISSITANSEAFYLAGVLLMFRLVSGIQNGAVGIVPMFTLIMVSSMMVIISYQEVFMNAGSSLIKNFKDGITAEAANVTTEMSNMMTDCETAVTSVSLYDAGVALVDGFASGITAETFAAEAAAKAMAEAALEAAREALDINSPSKAFRKLAYSVPEGFAQGIDKMQSVVKTSAVDMARTAIDSTKTALVRIGSVVNSDTEIIPTIRPVVDLDAFDARTIQLGANIDASISGPVDSLSQIVANAQNEINASNNEVIAAVNGLRADLNAIYNGEDQEVALYVDGKKLASTLAKPMNRQLNILSKRGAY